MAYTYGNLRKAYFEYKKKVKGLKEKMNARDDIDIGKVLGGLWLIDAIVEKIVNDFEEEERKNDKEISRVLLIQFRSHLCFIEDQVDDFNEEIKESKKMKILLEK